MQLKGVIILGVKESITDGQAETVAGCSEIGKVGCPQCGLVHMIDVPLVAEIRTNRAKMYGGVVLGSFSA